MEIKLFSKSFYYYHSMLMTKTDLMGKKNGIILIEYLLYGRESFNVNMKTRYHCLWNIHPVLGTLPGKAEVWFLPKGVTI